MSDFNAEGQNHSETGLTSSSAAPLVTEPSLRSKDDYPFKKSDPTWTLNKNLTIYVDAVRLELDKSLRDGFTETLAYFATERQATYTNNILARVAHYLRTTGATTFKTAAILNYRATLDRATEHHLQKIRAFLNIWFELDYPGIGQATYDLLNDLKLRNGPDGDAVKRRDPREGPLTDNELIAFNEGAVRGYDEDKITLDELTKVDLCSYTGRRPLQLSYMKLADLHGGQANANGEPKYIITIPRIKQHGNSFRAKLSAFEVSSEMWAILHIQRSQVIKQVEAILGFALSEKDREQLPLFPDLKTFNNVASIAALRPLLATDYLHQCALVFNYALRKVVEAANVRSERTGELLTIDSRRFRYTVGTRAAREGLGKALIAELLDHESVRAAHVYTEYDPNLTEIINAVVGHQLVRYAQAFQGVLVDSERDAIRGDDWTSRIRFHGKAIATCGTYGFCGANVPIPCYTCHRFQPWLEAPHEKVRDELLTERRRVLNTTNDPTMAGILDRTILAVVNVIERCNQRRAELNRTERK